MTPDGLLFAALALMCGMLSAGSNSWSNIPLLVALVLMALWVLALWRGTRALASITLRRRHAERIFAGDSIAVSVQLANLSRLPAAGLIVEESLEPDAASIASTSQSSAEKSARPQPRLPAAQGRAFFVAISGLQTVRAAYSVSLRRRGLYKFANSSIETVYPLGFFRSISTRRSPGQVIVYPRLGEVNTALFEDIEHALENMRRARPSRAEEEFRGLREYRKEDNPRWIHWRGSARAGELLVREFEEPLSKRVLLLLDTNLQRLGNRRFAAFENAISFAATVAREFAHRGMEVECIALQPGGTVARATISRSRRNLDALLEMLALLRRDDSRMLDALIEYVPRRSLHGAYVLVAGLGSLHSEAALKWLKAGDNAVRILDARGAEFSRIFRRDIGNTTKEQAADEDLLMSLGEEEQEALTA